jgi:hypothetical protein
MNGLAVGLADHRERGRKPNSRAIEKRERRARQEAELGERQRALPDKRYGVILADPPWRFEPFSRITGMDRAADNHYPTSALEEIKAPPSRRSPPATACCFFGRQSPCCRKLLR